MTQHHIERLVELLDLQPQTDTGNDDFVFGNYVEFPPASQIDPELFPAALEILGVPLPFSGAVTACSLQWLLVVSPLTRRLVLEAMGDPVVSITESGEFLLAFPNLTVSSPETIGLVDHLIPATAYENDLPESQRFWQPDPEDSDRDPDDELLDLYRSRPVTLSTLIRELDSLRTTFEAVEEVAVQKAILLACFSLVESFTRQRALLNVPRFPESPELGEFFLKLLRREVANDGRRSQVVKALEPKKSWAKQIPAWDLRNALAHDFGGVTIKNGELAFEGADSAIRRLVIDKLFEDLIGYAKKNLD